MGAVRLLIAAEAAVNQARDDGGSPLYMATQEGHAGFRLETTAGTGFDSPGHFQGLEGCNDYQLFWD